MIREAGNKYFQSYRSFERNTFERGAVRIVFASCPGAEIVLNAFAFDLFGFGVYTSPQEAAGALSFHDPLEGTEIL